MGVSVASREVIRMSSSARVQVSGGVVAGVVIVG